MATPDTIPTLGIVTTWIESAYWTSVISGASDALREGGASVVCFTLGYYDPSSPERSAGESHPFFELANAAAVDGLIVPAPAAFAAGAEAFFTQRRGLPMVSVGQHIPGIPSVVVDNVAGTQSLVRHLIDQCGYRRLAYVRGPTDNVEAEARYDAYVATLRERGIDFDPRLVSTGEFSEASGARATTELLDAGVEPDCIVTANDLMGLGALRILRQRGNLVPKDIGVAGFDDIEAAQGTPSLTTVRQPAYDLGRAAAELLLGKVRGESVRERIIFPAQLVLRDSTAGAGPRSRSMPPSSPSHSSLPISRPANGISFVEPGHATPSASASGKLLRLLREEVIPQLQEKPDIRGDAEELLRELEGLLAQATREAETYHRAAESAQALALLNLRRRSVRATSPANLMDHLTDLLPALNMDAFYVALLDSHDLGSARLVLAWESGRRLPLQSEGLKFDPKTLLPGTLRRRGQSTTSVVQPLQLGGEQLGYVVIRGRLYDAQLLSDVCQMLSSALSRLE